MIYMIHFILSQLIYKHGEKKTIWSTYILNVRTSFVSNLLHITSQELFLPQIAKIANLHSILPHKYPVARLALEIPRPALDAAVVLAAGFIQFNPDPWAWA